MEIYLGVVPGLLFIVLMLAAVVVHYVSVRSGAVTGEDDEGVFSYVYRALSPFMGLLVSVGVLLLSKVNPNYGLALFLTASLPLLYLIFLSIKDIAVEWKSTADYNNPNSGASVAMKQVQ